VTITNTDFLTIFYECSNNFQLNNTKANVYPVDVVQKTDCPHVMEVTLTNNSRLFELHINIPTLLRVTGDEHMKIYEIFAYSPFNMTGNLTISHLNDYTVVKDSEILWDDGVWIKKLHNLTVDGNLTIDNSRLTEVSCL